MTTVGNNEINDIKVNLSHILIDSLDDAKVNLTPVIDSILETFSKSPYINDVRILIDVLIKACNILMILKR